METLKSEELKLLDRLIRSLDDFSDDIFNSWSFEDKDKAQVLLCKIRKIVK